MGASHAKVRAGWYDCAAHFIRFVFALSHAVHFVAIETADVLLAMQADAPLAVGDAVAALANFARHRQRHLRFVRVIFLHRAVTGLTRADFVRERPGLAIELARVADEALELLAFPSSTR
jgi:hypothetical protein